MIFFIFSLSLSTFTLWFGAKLAKSFKEEYQMDQNKYEKSLPSSLETLSPQIEFTRSLSNLAFDWLQWRTPLEPFWVEPGKRWLIARWRNPIGQFSSTTLSQRTSVRVNV